MLAFDDLWPHLEPLSQPEIDAIYAAAGADLRYKVSLLCAFVGYMAVIFGLWFPIQAFYRAYHPALPVKLGVAALLLLIIWFSARLLGWLNQWFYNQAVMRQIRARASTHGA